MRRIFAGLVVLVFGLGTSMPSTAIEITNNETGITFSDAATSGSTHAVVWSRKNGSDGSKVFVSYKRGAAAWTAKRSIGTREWSNWTRAEVAVMTDGTIFVVWNGDEELNYRELAPNSNTWGAVQTIDELPANTYWLDEIDVVADGNAITIAGVAFGDGLAASISSVTRTSSNSDWQFETFGSAWPQAAFGACANPNNCEDQVGTVQISSNGLGAQTVVWQSSRIRNQNYDLKNSTFTIYAAKRTSLEAEWGSLNKLAEMSPKVSVNGYAFFIEDIATTAAGRSAVAWRSGFNSNPTKGFVAVSEAGSTNFSQTDTTPINSKGEINTVKLAAVGENIWGVVESVGNSAGWITRVGRISNFAKATTQPAVGRSFRVLDLAVSGNSPTILMAGDEGKSPRTLYSATVANNGALGAIKTVRALATTSSYIENSLVAEGSRLLVVLTGAKGSAWGIGLDAVLL